MSIFAKPITSIEQIWMRDDETGKIWPAIREHYDDGTSAHGFEDDAFTEVTDAWRPLFSALGFGPT